ncbi:MAG TPA: S8 family serine peptidase [Solirubrobacteraceae bacterium]|nr:S8 family serine peptidase [Solirubrobacteraceae bacterium]
MRRLTGLAVAAASLVFAAPAAATTDEHWDLQWGPQQVRAEQAWATSTGAGQVIAVVDSGVDLDHPDLDGKIVGGATFIDCADQPNGCGNGDWESGGQAAGAGDPHGTHVAGIAAAETDNGIGVAGVARDASILAVKSLGEEGGSFEDIAAGIRWSVDHGADVVNLSLGALPGVQALTITGVIADVQEAIAYARANGAVVVAAAGNDTASVCGTPGFDEGALCVAATDRNEVRAWYSNFAFKPDLATVSGPGGAGTLECRDDIISTVPPDAEDGFCETSEGTPGYDFYAGTSMATPAVSGVAALLTAQGRTDEQTMDILMSTARTPGTGSRGTYTPTYGYGIVDAAAALAE